MRRRHLWRPGTLPRLVTVLSSGGDGVSQRSIEGASKVVGTGPGTALIALGEVGAEPVC